MVHFGEFLKSWSLRSNRVTRQISFNRSKIGGKCQNWKIQMRHFWWFSNTVHFQGFLRVAKEIFHWCWNKGWDQSSDCGGIWFDQSHQGKSTIENTQMYALGMKLARFSNSPQEKQDFQGKSEKVWNFLTNKTGILNGTTFQVFFSTLSQCLKITEKVSFNIASEAS